MKPILRLYNGFSLIELIIVLSIVAITSLFTYPYFSNYILRSHRLEAISALIQNQTLLENCYLKSFSYKCKDLTGFLHFSSGNHYAIRLSKIEASAYMLEAVALGSQNEDRQCLRFAVNEANAKRAWDANSELQLSCWTS